MNCLDGSCFDKQAIVNQQIEAERHLSVKLLVPDDHLVLNLHLAAPQLKFHRETPLVDRLKQSRPFVPVDLNRRTDDVMGDAGGSCEQGMHNSPFEQQRRQR